MTVDSPQSVEGSEGAEPFVKAIGREISWLIISGPLAGKKDARSKVERFGSYCLAIAAVQAKVQLPDVIMEIIRKRMAEFEAGGFEAVAEQVPSAMALQIERIDRAIAAEAELALQAALRLTAVPEEPSERPWFDLGLLRLARVLRTRRIGLPVWLARDEGRLLQKHCPLPAARPTPAR